MNCRTASTAGAWPTGSIHKIATAEPSPYVPRPGHTPPEPKWKGFEMFADVLPRGGAKI